MDSLLFPALQKDGNEKEQVDEMLKQDARS